MTDTLSQWEAECKSFLGNQDCLSSAKERTARILSLIDLVRRKDALLQDVIRSWDENGDPYYDKVGEAFALTEQLK